MTSHVVRMDSSRTWDRSFPSSLEGLVTREWYCALNGRMNAVTAGTWAHGVVFLMLEAVTLVCIGGGCLAGALTKRALISICSTVAGVAVMALGAWLHVRHGSSAFRAQTAALCTLAELTNLQCAQQAIDVQFVVRQGQVPDSSPFLPFSRSLWMEIRTPWASSGYQQGKLPTLQPFSAGPAILVTPTS